MTVAFDNSAREKLNQRDCLHELEYNGMKVKDMIVKPLQVKDVRPYISTFHYSQSTPDSTRFTFGGYFGDKLAGVITYGMGANHSQYKYLIPNIENGEYLELTRLWSPDSMPKNTESKLIAESLKMLPREIKLVVSYSDTQQNHVGTIYQATNWLYCGTTTGGKMLIDENGTIRHTKSINMVRLRHPEYKGVHSKTIMKDKGWEYVEGGVKHRYCMLRGSKKEKKELFSMVKDKVEDYPKLDIK